MTHLDNQRKILFLKYKIHSQYQTYKSCQMIPFQLHFKGNHRKNGKYSKRYYLLNHLQLHDIKRTATVFKSQTIGRNLQTIFKKSNRPAESDYSISGNAANQLNSSRIFKCPYHANVIKTFENTSNTIEYIPCETIF